ncbi:2Fe-2S iron-sulfur cluster-binding protein [uncultured Eubacterium sp.]|uniref:2Fe-2S iron-sulfur cluster-binding protein n=1 Tax=uncultured Eubacterium sp. TaxID=165185 RepID=UPI00338D9A5F
MWIRKAFLYTSGACGTCHVLVDGVAMKVCIPTLSMMDGKSILTVEGFSDEEKELYAYAFAESGAVQCGFCIPGMVICTKGLLDVNPNPTRDEIAFALRNNICRCTGYKKIMDAVELAAKIKREGKGIPKKELNISQIPSGKYYVSILVETEHVELPHVNQNTGIDLGIKELCITSAGKKYENPKSTSVLPVL